MTACYQAWTILNLVVLITACVSIPYLPPAQVVSRFPLPPTGTDAVGSLVAVRAHATDTLLDLARYFDVGHDEILDANPKVNPSLPGKGTRVILPTQHLLPQQPRQGIVINLAALRLYYYPNDNLTVITHPTGIGRENWETPKGSTNIVAKMIDPPWRIPPSIRAEHARQGNSLPEIIPAGPDNPLGQYALRLGIPGYLIHGTNRPYGIGMRVSHGCIQLYPEDISALYPQVPLGTMVTIINQPYLIGRIAGRPYLEAHPPPEDLPLTQPSAILEQIRQAMREAQVNPTEIDWHLALQTARMMLRIPLPIHRGAPSAGSVIAAIPLVKTGVIAGTWDRLTK